MAHKVEIVSKCGKTYVKIDGNEIHASYIRFEHSNRHKVPELVVHVPALDVSLDADWLPTMPEPWKSLWGDTVQMDSGNVEANPQE